MIAQEEIAHINTVGTDFRSDVIVAGMVDGGVDADRVVVLRRQSEARLTDKEIIDIEYKRDYEGNGRDMLLVRTNRNGIYDNLPEGLFHDTSGLKGTSKEVVIDSIKRQNKQEFYIRRFFSLYEAEVERTRMEMQLTELRYDRTGRHRTFVDALARLWPVIAQMELRTAMLFTRVIPYIPEIRNSYRETARAIALITGYRVQISEEIGQKTPPVKFPRLGTARLGVNSVLKGKFRYACATVTVTPPQKELRELLPGCPGRRVLEGLLELFLPNSTDYRIVLVPEQAGFTGRIGGRRTPCLLGINSKLTKRTTTDESKEQ